MGERMMRLRCPLCSHPRKRHLDGRARQTLNTMGCASCATCEQNRQALTECDSRPIATTTANTRDGDPSGRGGTVEFGRHFAGGDS